VCEKIVPGAGGLHCTRCYFTVHATCVSGASQPCITMTSIRSTRSSAPTEANTAAAAATTAAVAAPAAAAPANEEKAATEELYEQGSVWDKYTRKGVLGKGGCGVVYKVVNKLTKEAFALKQMKKDSYLLDILEREIMIMKKFDHPHLTKLREAYLDDKFICLVMDYVAGGELFDKIAELEFFSEKDAADITKQLLSALNYLHDRGCAHRDIKAENILLVDKEGTQVKIADFGLANTLGNRNKFMSFVGTTPYMAPEVLSGACFPESDHQLLTNRGFMSLADVEAHIVVDHGVVDWRGLAFASYDREAAQLVYEQPRALVINKVGASPPLVAFAGRGAALDLVATANHEMFVQLGAGAAFCMMTAGDVAAALASPATSLRFMTQPAHGARSDAAMMEFDWSLAALVQYGKSAILDATAVAPWVWLLERDAVRAIVAGLTAHGPTVVTADAALRDELLRLALHAGYSATFVATDAGQWAVTFDAAGAAGAPVDAAQVVDDAATLARYERDRTWCCQMPSGFVVVRRVERDAKGGVVRASRASIQGNSYGTNVDMWSLGVLVFVMLAGYMPFSGKTEMQEIRAILGGQYKFDPRRGWDKISASAKNFISNLLLQDPDARFTAAQALQHPWIRGRSLSGRQLDSLPSLHNIRDFQRESKRHQAVKMAGDEK
jgi:serine/threonine protein kinase